MPSNGDLPRYIHNELVGVYALLIRSRRSSTAAQIKFITNSNSNNNSNNSSTSFTTSFESLIINNNPHDLPLHRRIRNKDEGRFRMGSGAIRNISANSSTGSRLSWAWNVYPTTGTRST
eukprot:GEZU01022742.1.p1 GENE.GEZU01022742.1~~GEZU01022742.1.p1  ORF type:complete len:119 (-),score=14.96 GEZU01022742.1:255-611(-)